MELIKCVADGDFRGLADQLRISGGVDINTPSPEDGSTPLHFAASTGDVNCLKVLLNHPLVNISAQNLEGNTALHVATAYTHLQAIKLLLKSGDRPHSFHVLNSKNKQALDYAWNPEVKAYLEDYQQAFVHAYSLPDDPHVLKKHIINVTMEVAEFQDKVRETIYQLIEQKHVALHKVNLLEQAAGIQDEGSANNYINQLSYLQDMNERQTAEIASLKNKIQLLEQQAEEMQQFQGSKTPSAKAEEVTRLEKFEEERKKQDTMDEQSGQIVFVTAQDGTKSLKGGTKEKLVERLTAFGTHFDLQYLQAFLLTYRAFMSPDELFSLICKSWENLEAADASTALPVRLRIVNTIKYWMENYWFDFSEDPALLEKLKTLVNSTMSSQPKLQQQLTRVLERKVSGQDTDILEKKPLNCPKPIYAKKNLTRKQSSSGESNPKLQRQQTLIKGVSADKRPISLSVANLEKLKSKILRPGTSEDADDMIPSSRITDFDPLELARQITLIEFEMFKSIKPTEFLDQAWLSKDKEKLAPGILAMTKWSTRLSKWVISELVSEGNVKMRANLYERFVAIAQCLEKLNNYNGCIAILTGLQASPIYRLKDTLSNVNSRVRRLAEELMKANSSELNYKKLRERVHASDPPLIPFPGVYLQDLVFLDAGSKSYMDPDKRIINFQKHLTCARYIQELMGYQHSTYALEPVPEIQDFLKTTEVIQSEDEQYNKSLECEPRTS